MNSQQFLDLFAKSAINPNWIKVHTMSSSVLEELAAHDIPPKHRIAIEAWDRVSTWVSQTDAFQIDGTTFWPVVVNPVKQNPSNKPWEPTPIANILAVTPKHLLNALVEELRKEDWEGPIGVDLRKCTVRFDLFNSSEIELVKNLRSNEQLRNEMRSHLWEHLVTLWDEGNWENYSPPQNEFMTNQREITEAIEALHLAEFESGVEFGSLIVSEQEMHITGSGKATKLGVVSQLSDLREALLRVGEDVIPKAGVEYVMKTLAAASQQDGGNILPVMSFHIPELGSYGAIAPYGIIMKHRPALIKLCRVQSKMLEGRNWWRQVNSLAHSVVWVFDHITSPQRKFDESTSLLDCINAVREIEMLPNTGKGRKYLVSKNPATFE